VHQTLLPISYISFFGVALFRLNINKDKDEHFSAYSFVPGILQYLYHVLCVIKLPVVYPIKTATGIFVMSTILAFTIFMRQKLVRIIQNIIVVDEIFVRLGKKLNYHRSFRFNFCMSMVIVIYHVSVLCFSFFYFRNGISWEMVLLFVSSILPYLNMHIMLLIYICITRLVKSRFSMINEVSELNKS